MDPTGAEQPVEARVDVFEVFKSGWHLLGDLKLKDLAELRRTYVVIQPVRTIEDLDQPGIALGTMAPEKMVVDREQFKEQVAKKIQEAVALKRTHEVDAGIERLKQDADEMFRREARQLRTTVLAKVLAIVNDDTTGNNDEKELAIRKCFDEITIPIDSDAK
jgi:hypothetical protein